MAKTKTRGRRGSAHTRSRRRENTHTLEGTPSAEHRPNLVFYPRLNSIDYLFFSPLYCSYAPLTTSQQLCVKASIIIPDQRRRWRKKKKPTRTGGSESMEYFMMPTEKISSLQQFKKTEKDVIGGLCRFVLRILFWTRVWLQCVCVCVCEMQTDFT